MVDTTEAEDHQVLDELQRGYKLKDRLLRPSMVKVARNSQALIQQSSTERIWERPF